MSKLRHAALTIALGIGLAGCGGHDAEPAKPQPRTVQAKTAQVQASVLPVLHSAPATVVAEQRVEVASRLMGYLRDIAVAEGQSVSRGQHLFSVDPLDVEGQVEQARLGVRQAEDSYRDAKADYERFANLLKEEVVSRQQYEKMKLQHDTAAARLDQAKAGLATATGQLRYAAVASPIAGVVTRKLADAGDLATPGQPVLVVENPARLQIETHVPQAIFASLRLGQAIAVAVDGLEQPLQAKVARLSPAADPVSHTFTVKMDTQAVGLKSGAFARVLFPVAERQSLRVPQTALVNRAGIAGLFVVGQDGIAQFRMVRTGEAQAGQVEIQAGLDGGERIVVEGAEHLESGDRVQG
jgi:RND family efflux transporter MFP subunit